LLLSIPGLLSDQQSLLRTSFTLFKVTIFSQNPMFKSLNLLRF
jgi:hypothetical protein